MLLNFADVTINKNQNMYTQIYRQIKSSVAQGNLKRGERLPSVREASAQLGVSRTTVENAYTKLCIEGIIESRPQRGYFIIGIPESQNAVKIEKREDPPIVYDFSSRLIDTSAADTDLWKKLVRSVLWDTTELSSYGEAQGEIGLREALADYAYKARGVVTSSHNIVIGAGVGPLLNILCGLIGTKVTVGFENGGFAEAEHIFSDYGISVQNLVSDKNGATKESLEAINPKILFLLPSALGKLSPTALSGRRNMFCDWVKEGQRLIIEDDYNGELRFFARSVPAFQPKAPQSTVYIGSFSKLLLPSVRIAYMVLPDFLAEKFRSLSRFYNQTCGKIEQLALEKYIVTGALEKHLKKLRRLYYTKGQILCEELRSNLECIKSLRILESSLTVEIETDLNINPKELMNKAASKGVQLGGCQPDGTLRLCFSGIETEKIPLGVKKVKEILGNI